MVVPNNQPWVFPTKNDHFGLFWVYHYLRKHPFPKINLSHPVAPSLPHLKPSRTSTQIQPGEVAKPLKLGDFDGFVGGIQRENHRKTLLNPPVSKESQKHFRGLFFSLGNLFRNTSYLLYPQFFLGGEQRCELWDNFSARGANFLKETTATTSFRFLIWVLRTASQRFLISAASKYLGRQVPGFQGSLDYQPKQCIYHRFELSYPSTPDFGGE